MIQPNGQKDQKEEKFAQDLCCTHEARFNLVTEDSRYYFTKSQRKVAFRLSCRSNNPGKVIRGLSSLKNSGKA